MRRDDRLTAAELVAATVAAMIAGDREAAVLGIRRLEQGPASVVRAELDRALLQRRTLLARHGWSDEDCGELERRRLKAPAEASDIERAVRVLALLCDAPALPSVAPRAVVADDDGMLAKIRALLAKAESTTFPAEAEALTAKAQELMARHRVDHLLLDASGGSSDGAPVGRRIWLDDPYSDAKSQLLHVVAKANGCQSVHLGSLGLCHVIGFAVDLDVVELLHTSLLVQATSAMAAAGPQRDARGRSRTRSFRQSFLVAYAHRIGDRLLDATESVEAEAVKAHGNLLPVLARREAEVGEAVAVAFPRLTSRYISVTNRSGWAAGTAAADLADLSVGERLAR